MTTTPKFEDFEKFSKQQMELMNTFSSTFTKGMQEIAAEAAEYSKKAFAANSALVEQLLAAKPDIVNALGVMFADTPVCCVSV